MRPLRQGSYLGKAMSSGTLKRDRIINATDKLTVLRQIAQGQGWTSSSNPNLRPSVARTPGVAGKASVHLSFLPAIDYSFGIRRSYPEAQRMVDRVEAAIVAMALRAQATLLACGDAVDIALLAPQLGYFN